jgi:hypothetical protein
MECVREVVLMYTDPPPRDTDTEQVPELPPLIKPFSFIEQAPLFPSVEYCSSSSDSPPVAVATVNEPVVSDEDVIDTASEVCGLRNPKNVRCRVSTEILPSGCMK